MDAPDPDPVVERVEVEVETDPLVPEELQGQVAIRNYQWSDEDSPSIAFALENLTATETFHLELSSKYYDRAGELRFQSPWSRFELKPGKRHHYFSQSNQRGVTQGRALIRMVGDSYEEVDSTGP